MITVDFKPFFQSSNAMRCSELELCPSLQKWAHLVSFLLKN